MSEITNIAFGNIANALKSMASDHILTIAEDIYDVSLKKYQSEINASILTQNNASEMYLPKTGGTLTGTLTSTEIKPSVTDSYSLGTSSLQFRNIYGTTIYENGTSLASKYAPISHTHTISDISDFPSIPAIPSNNVTGSGTSGYLVKWNGTNSVTDGPRIGSDTTTYLRNDGLWATPHDTTYSAATYNSLGLLKPAYTSTNEVRLTTSAASNINIPIIQAKTTTSGRYYAVEADKNGVPYVNVPWTDTNTDTISIHTGTAEIDAVNISVIPNVVCTTLSTPTVGTRLQVKLSRTYTSLTQLHVANITAFYLNNNTTTRYTITKNGKDINFNNVSTDGVLDLLFINNTSAELIYKSNISNNYVFYGTCSTAATTQTKTLNVTESGFELVPGTKLVVDFINENTANTPTLNINGTGAKSIIYGDGSAIGYMPAGPQLFVFYAENNNIAAGVWKCTSAPTFISSIYATCSNRPNTSAKTASVTNFTDFTRFRLFKGAIANVQFTSANTAASSLTLNVANTGAKPIYYLNTNYGSSAIQNNYLTWEANSVVQFVYDGTYWIAVSNTYVKNDSSPSN